MFKPIPVSIGLRYLRAKRRNGFISFISMASILGIAIGVAALITTLAVMSGFQREIRDRMLQMAAHATVSADGDVMQNWRQAVTEANRDPRVAGAAPYIETQALLSLMRRLRDGGRWSAGRGWEEAAFPTCCLWLRRWIRWPSIRR